MSGTITRVLVVDDEEILRTLMESVLSLEGFAVDTSASAEDAMIRLARSEYDLVIADNSMPGMQGLDLLAEIRRTRPELPVVIMTAYGSIEVSMRAHELGAAGYLLKPFEDIHAIAEEVRRVVARSDRERLAKG